MSHLDILLPFGLPPTELAADLFRQLKTPALATLVSHAKSPQICAYDAFSRALPHEVWLSRQFDLEDRLRTNGSPPVAAAAMHALGLTAAPGVWFLLQPVHIHIARDHLVLTDLRQLAVSEQESRALFDAAKPLFGEVGMSLLYGSAQMWFVRADDWSDMQTSTPDATCGHNIDIWMPKGSGERMWRKLQNEVQMDWFAHPVNAERESSGLKPVNSIWLWGGSPMATPTSSAATRYRATFNLNGWIDAFSVLSATRKHNTKVDEVIAAAPRPGLLVLDQLIPAALGGDWSEWLAHMHTLEAEWFAPLLHALKAGTIAGLTLVATHNTKSSELSLARSSLRKFWIKPSLARLKQ